MAAGSLWYLLVIIPVLGSGLIVTIQSWILAFRERTLRKMSVATWNSYAQIYNTAGAIDGIGDAFGAVVDLFTPRDSDDSSDALVRLVIGIVTLALAGGVVLTAVLIKHYAGRLAAPARV